MSANRKASKVSS